MTYLTGRETLLTPKVFAAIPGAEAETELAPAPQPATEADDGPAIYGRGSVLTGDAGGEDLFAKALRNRKLKKDSEVRSARPLTPVRCTVVPLDYHCNAGVHIQYWGGGRPARAAFQLTDRCVLRRPCPRSRASPSRRARKERCATSMTPRTLAHQSAPLYMFAD